MNKRFETLKSSHEVELNGKNDEIKALQEKIEDLQDRNKKQAKDDAKALLVGNDAVIKNLQKAEPLR